MLFSRIELQRQHNRVLVGLLFLSLLLAPAVNKTLRSAEEEPADQKNLVEQQEEKKDEPNQVDKASPADESDKPNPDAAIPEEAAPEENVVVDLEGKEVKLRFRFAEKPWESVIKLFAEQSGFSLTYSSMPPGSFTYDDDQAYTPAEAIDLINSVLLTKGYSLVRHKRMLFVINLEDGIPPALVEAVPVEELDKRGKYEIVKCVFPLKSIAPEEAEKELKPLLGPQGSLHVIPTARQVMITETAGNLRMIQRVIESGDNPSGGKSTEVAQHVLQFISAEEVLLMARPLLGLEEDKNTSDDIKLSIDPLGTRVFATGKPEMIMRLAKLIPLIDRDPGDNAMGPSAAQKSQLVVYDVMSADPATVLSVMQSLLTGQPGVRLATDPKTGNLVAQASAADHATIKATLDEMERNRGTFEVLPLGSLDPQIAILAINKLLGLDPESDTGPRIDGDPVRKQLWVRGSKAEVDQVRQILETLNKQDESAAAVQQTGNVRFIPLSSRAARRVLEEAEFLWPAAGRTNRIRIVTPNGNKPPQQQPKPETDSQPNNQLPGPPPVQPIQPDPKKEAPAPNVPVKKKSDATALDSGRVNIRFVGFPSQLAQNDKPDEASKEPAPEKKPTDAEKPPIVVSLSPGGIVIASQDIDALNDFQRLLQQLVDQQPAGGRGVTVFPLTYSKAEDAALLVNEILSGSVDDEGEAGGILSQLGGSFQAGGEVSIIPDKRLNTLIVQGSATDLDLIEQLLEIIDRESSVVDVQTAGKPRLIPVFTTSAEEIAGVVRQVYVNRIQGGSAQGGNSQQAMLQAFARARGGNQQGGRRGGGNNNDDQQMLSLGVDTRSNSLVVTAPEPLFQEVKALVEQLDRASVTQSKETIQVVTLRRANPELIQKALQSLVGESVKTNTTTSSANNGNQNNRGPTSQSARDQERMRADMFNRLQFQRFRGSDPGQSRSGLPSGIQGSSRGRPQPSPSRGK